MKFKIAVVIALAIGPLAGSVEPSVALDVSTADDSTSPSAVPGEFIVRASPAGAEAAGFTAIDDLGFGWTLATISSSSSVDDPSGQASELARISELEVEPNYLYQLAEEPLFSDQWALENTGQTGGTSDADIDILDAWLETTGSPGVTIAVLDSGVTLGHPDVAPVLWVNSGEIGGNGIDDDGNGYPDDVNGWDALAGDSDPSDVDGHGTFVASVAGGAVTGVGLAGVAPDSVLMPIRVCGGGGCPLSAIISGLNYAVVNNADVVNMSFGGSIDSVALEAAVLAVSNAGITLVAAAGNDGFLDNDVSPFYPANYEVDGLISVAATNDNDALASFSHYGSTTVDLAAPGVNVLGAWVPAGWAVGSGTSFAAPHVAGVAALVKSLYPDASPTQVKAMLLRSVDVVPGLIGKSVSGGRLNAGAALINLPPVAKGSVTPTLGEAPLRVSASAKQSNDPDGVISEWLWAFDSTSVSGEESSLLFDSIGRNNLALTVTDDLGASDTASFQVLVGEDFADTDGSVFHDAITWLSAMGFTTGCNPPVNDRFCPDDFMTRGEMAVFLVRAMGYIDNGGGNLFIDDDGRFYENSADRLFTAKVTLGCNPSVNNKYCGEDDVTRGQMAAFLVRAMGYTDNGGGDLFIDDDGNLFEKAIDRLGAAKVTMGCNPPDNDKFCPDDLVTRGQMAAFLKRALED